MNKKIALYIFFLFSIISVSSGIQGEISNSQKELLEQLPADKRDSILTKIEEVNDLQDEIEEAFEKEETLIERPEARELEKSEKCDDCIYGYEFFKYSPSTFIQSDNFPVPPEYTLGPGDKLLINYFGNKTISQESFLSRSGDLILPLLGPINISGMSFNEATKLIRNKVKDELIGTEVSVSLNELRPISIYLLGEAYKPGLYTVSGLSSVSNALFVSGGVNENGSLRNIEIKRNGETIGTYDFYDFLLKGNLSKEIKLADGDIIFIPFIKNKVKVDGGFKRPANYEFKDGETVQDAIDLAGGFISNVPPNFQIELSSIDSSNFERKLNLIGRDRDSLDRKLLNEDILTVSYSPKVAQLSIKLSGEFNRPGVYSFDLGDTLLDVVRRAGGYTEQAYTSGAVYLRESVAEAQKEGFKRSADQLEQTLVNVITRGIITDINESTLTPLISLITRLKEIDPPGRLVVDVDMLTLKTDPIKNIKIQNGDTLHIPTRPSSVSIAGEVLNTSSQYFYPERGVFDYINLAGGLTENADPKRIFIVYPDGQSQIVKNTLFSSSDYVLPGSTIVVSRLSRPLDGVNLAQIITPILADLATSAAAIAAISD